MADSDSVARVVDPRREAEAQATLGIEIEQRWGSFLGLRRQAWMEILVILIGLTLLDEFVFSADRFINVYPHPYWIVVVLASVQYGSGAGIVATVFASILLLAGNLPVMQIDEDLHQWFWVMSKRPLLWLATSVVVGELSARHIRERKRMAVELAQARNHEVLLTEAFEDVQAMRERLEVHVAGQLRTVSRTWAAARSIERLDPARVLLGITDMVTTLLEPTKFSVFTFTDNRLQAAIQKGWRRKDRYERYFTETSPLFRALVGQHRILTVANPDDEVALDGQGKMAGPLVNPETGEMIGMLKIEELGFAQLSVSTQENFRFICQWIGSVYGNAVRHQESQALAMFNSEDNLYSEAFFVRHREFLSGLAQRIGFDLTMLTVTLRNHDQLPESVRNQFTVALGQAVSDALRNTDLAFNQRSRSWEFAVMLPGTPEAGARIVVQKLSELLAGKIDRLAMAPDYEIGIEVLVTPASPLINDAPRTPTLPGSESYYVAQKHFLTDLSRRMKFALTELKIQFPPMGEADSSARTRFIQAARKALDSVWPELDMPIELDMDVGEISVLLSATGAGEVRARETDLLAALTARLDAFPGVVAALRFDVSTLVKVEQRDGRFRRG
ncbi:MAG: GAF domain-containing protein [Gammaproteobacteria bacterium]|nr:GAF domain-containing protein [Gammaproteobacteria bacterium]MCP5136850.1 GAF domain-containing protein [Gammaproteobacteria bacterium]